MARFDISEYEPVEDRLRKFWTDHPEGRVLTELIAYSDTQFILRAEVYVNREDTRPVATGIAEEQVTGSGVNRTSAAENGECVPLTVPALTRNGWKFQHQLRVGDEVLAYSVSAGVLQWEPIQRLTRFDNHTLVRIGNSRFRADCTPNHKWVIDGVLQEWNQRKGQRILLAAPLGDESAKRVDDAERLAWLFTDGQVQHRNGMASRAEINQSKTENFADLDRLFGEVSRVKVEAGQWMQAKAWPVPADEVRRILGEFGVNTEHDLPVAVLGMSRTEAEAFLAAAMQADGDGRRFAKTHRAVVDAVQNAAILTDRATGPITERWMTGSTKPLFVVPLHQTAEKWLSEFTEQLLPPQDVWCPTTPSGTWVGLFNGQPAITGNTSAIGRALANFGYATKGKRPSREEMQKVQRGATIRQAVAAKVLTDEDTAALRELIASVAGMDEAQLKDAWRAHTDVLEVHVDGATLADAILARKTTLDQG